MIAVQEIQEIKRTHNYMSRGSARSIYPVNDNVIMKVPYELYFYNGVWQSWDELSFYNSLPNHWKKYFAQLLGSVIIPVDDEQRADIGHKFDEYPVLFFEKVIPLEEVEEVPTMDCIFEVASWYYGFQKASEFKEDIIKLCMDTELCDVMDHVGNWGINRNGDLVVLDAGMFGYGGDAYYYNRNYEYSRYRSSFSL